MALPTTPLHWRFLAHGPVQRQLVPHVLGVAAKGKAYTTLTPEEWVVLESRIAANISANSLLLDTETDRDGDCGLDATLRNLERLRPTNTPSQNIIRVLATKWEGESAASHAPPSVHVGPRQRGDRVGAASYRRTVGGNGRRRIRAIVHRCYEVAAGLDRYIGACGAFSCVRDPVRVLLTGPTIDRGTDAGQL
jgi:hypothetical protein